MTIVRPIVRGLVRPMARTLVEGGGGVSFASILALNPELAFAPSQTGAAYQERTGASATTVAGNGDSVGSFKNFGTLAGWVTAASDAARPVMRHDGALRYLEPDAVDDALSGSLAALRGAAGWTMISAVRATANVAFSSVTSNGTTSARATQYFSGDAYTAGGRRNNADGFATVAGNTHLNEKIVLTAIGDFAGTTLKVRANGVQENQSTSWLTAGVTPSDFGNVHLFWLGGALYWGDRYYGGLLFPSVLSGANLALAERWAAEQIGITI